MLRGLSRDKFAEQDHLPWGTFDVRYAAPQVVALSLACASAPFAAPSDLWSMGIVLFEVAAGREYWLGYNQLEVTQALVGVSKMPHERDPMFFDQCGEVRFCLAHCIDSCYAFLSHVCTTVYPRNLQK